jgi:hypothetical protein
MNPQIYKSKADKQAAYRRAKKLGMTCAEYRAAQAAGKIPPDGNSVTVPHHVDPAFVREAVEAGVSVGYAAKHLKVSRKVVRACLPKPESTPAPREAVAWAQRMLAPTVTPPKPAKADDPRYTSESPVHIRTKCGLMRDSVKALCGASGGCLTLSTVKPEYMESDYEGKHIRILVNKAQPNCAACFAKLEEIKAKRRKVKVAPTVTPDETPSPFEDPDTEFGNCPDCGRIALKDGKFVKHWNPTTPRGGDKEPCPHSGQPTVTSQPHPSQEAVLSRIKKDAEFLRNGYFGTLDADEWREDIDKLEKQWSAHEAVKCNPELFAQTFADIRARMETTMKSELVRLLTTREAL